MIGQRTGGEGWGLVFYTMSAAKAISLKSPSPANRYHMQRKNRMPETGQIILTVLVRH